MKVPFRLFRRRGVYYSEDTETGEQKSLNTTDKRTAQRLLNAKIESAQMGVVNLQIARAYMVAADPQMPDRTWGDVVDFIIDEKKEGPSKHRWKTVRKDKALRSLWRMKVVETRADQMLMLVNKGTVSTNVYLRRLHNYAFDMNWLPWPIVPKRRWPKIVYKSKRAITREEHLRIVEREGNQERQDFYDLLWELGGSQSDIAYLEGEDVDWSDWTICYNRKKLAGLSATDIKPPLIKFGKRCAEILHRLPQVGALFRYLRSVDCKDRATEFRQRCEGLKIEGVTLHSYRYAWAERARKAHYPRRQAEEALGHNSKAVHIAYAKRAQVTVDSLEEYEERVKQKILPVEFAGKESSLPAARP
jgi:hypothetical protein